MRPRSAGARSPRTAASVLCAARHARRPTRRMRNASGTVRAADSAVARTAPITPSPAQTSAIPRASRRTVVASCRAASAWNRCSPCRTPCATLIGTDATTNGASSSAETMSTSRNRLKSGASRATTTPAAPGERHRRLQRALAEAAHVALAARRAQRGRLVRDGGLDDAERHREDEHDREQRRERRRTRPARASG